MRLPMMRLFTRAAIATSALLAGVASAQNPKCEDLPKPVYLTGSSAVQNMIKSVAVELAKSSDPMTLVYVKAASCIGAGAIVMGDPLPNAGAVYWKTDGATGACDMPAQARKADVGLSDIAPTTCTNPKFDNIPTDVKDVLGPVQTMELVVPAASANRAISAEMAYLVFGFGEDKSKNPTSFADNTRILRRNDQSGTQHLVARAISVPAAKWKGVDKGGSSDVLASLKDALCTESLNACIGILGAENADVARDKVKPLAFQAKGQYCAFTPDSSETSFDKLNVREGRYPIWGPLHMLTKVDGSGKPVNGNVARFFEQFEKPSDSFLKAQIESHVIPKCAMKVWRERELGDSGAELKENKDDCGCFFDSVNGKTSCSTCKQDSDCGGEAKHCRHGYCEVN